MCGGRVEDSTNKARPHKDAFVGEKKEGAVRLHSMCRIHSSRTCTCHHNENGNINLGGWSEFKFFGDDVLAVDSLSRQGGN
jgi:hypothetical protein